VRRQIDLRQKKITYPWKRSGGSKSIENDAEYRLISKYPVQMRGLGK